MKYLFIILVFLLITYIYILSEDNNIESIKKEFQENQLKKEDIFHKIVEIEKQQKKLLNEENRLLTNIFLIEQEISNITSNIIKTENNLSSIKQKINTLEYEVKEKINKFKKNENSLSLRINNYIKQSLINEMNISNNILFKLDKNDLSDDILNKKFMQKILIAENDNISKLLFEKNIIELSNEKIKEEKIELEKANTLLSSQLRDLKTKKEELDYYFADINKDTKKTIQLIEEYKNQQITLSRVLNELEKMMETLNISQLNENAKFENNKNLLIYPVKKINIINNFGTNRLDRYTNIKVLNNGIDFLIDENASIYSVNEGSILFADYFHGYGNMVIIDHGNGYRSIYSNLDEIIIQRGNKVKSGDIIGIIRGDFHKKSLHFELRYMGSPLNPEEWFQKSEL